MSRFAAQVAQERAHGRKLARRGRPRLAALVELADEPPNGVAIERGGPELARLQPTAPAAACARNCVRSLSYARTVCTDALRLSLRNWRNALRCAVIGPARSEAVPTGASLDGLQAVPPPIEVGERALGDRQLPRQLAARRRLAIGSMMPNVMFDGS